MLNTCTEKSCKASTAEPSKWKGPQGVSIQPPPPSRVNARLSPRCSGLSDPNQVLIMIRFIQITRRELPRELVKG